MCVRRRVAFEKYADRACIGFARADGNGYASLSYGDVGRRVLSICAALRRFFPSKDLRSIAICSENRVEWLLADFGTPMCRVLDNDELDSWADRPCAAAYTFAVPAYGLPTEQAVGTSFDGVACCVVGFLRSTSAGSSQTVGSFTRRCSKRSLRARCFAPPASCPWFACQSLCVCVGACVVICGMSAREIIVAGAARALSGCQAVHLLRRGSGRGPSSFWNRRFLARGV